MKLVAAVLAVLGILALGAAAIEHFDHVIPSASDHLSLIIAVAGVAALGIGWALSHVGGSEE
jgi:hypothetical protein